MIRFVCRCGAAYARLDDFCAHLAVCQWPAVPASRAAEQRRQNATRLRVKRSAMTPGERAAWNQREAARQRRRRAQKGKRV